MRVEVFPGTSVFEGGGRVERRGDGRVVVAASDIPTTTDTTVGEPQLGGVVTHERYLNAAELLDRVKSEVDETVRNALADHTAADVRQEGNSVVIALNRE